MAGHLLRTGLSTLLICLALFTTPLPAALVQTGNVEPNVNSWNSLTMGYIGRTSDGSVLVDAGSSLTSSYVYVGYYAGTAGAARVEGPGSKWANSVSLNVGYYGNGSVTVAAGGQVSSAIGYLGSNSGSTGTATVTGLGSKWTNTYELNVGRSGNGTLTVADGGEVVTGSLYASLSDLLGNGRITATGGVVNADLVFDAAHGDQAVLSFGSGGTLTVKAAGAVLGAGYKLDGSMTVTDGVNISSSNGQLGYYSGSTGAATVTGAGSKWTNSDSLYLGRGGSGSLTIENGGQVSDTHGFVGYSTGSTGAATVTGTSSNWTNSGSLIVGYEGSGMLTVLDGGEIVAAELYGSQSDLFGDGTITATNGGIVDADLVFDAAHGNRATVSFGSGGTLAVQVAGGNFGVGYRQRGTLIVTDGVHISSSSGSLGSRIGSTGVATVTGVGSTWTNSVSLNVGGRGTGTLTIEAGGQISSVTGNLASGGGSGTVRVSGAASTWTNSGVLRVGNLGHGTLTVEAGGEVSSSSAYLGYGAGSTGAATVIGTSSKWTNNGSLYVGYDGSGALTIMSGGLAKVFGSLTIDNGSDNDSFINMATGGMLALAGDADDSLAQFLGLVNGTDAIRFWDATLGNWASLTSATYGDDYTLSYITEGDLAGYTLLTVGRVGDFDADGDVDGRDFLAWQRNTSLGSLADWQDNYGAGTLAGVEDDPARSFVVPEPGGWVLAIGLVMVGWSAGRNLYSGASDTAQLLLPLLGQGFLKRPVNAVHQLDRRRVLAAFNPRDGFLPRTSQLGQFLLSQAGRAPLADDVPRQTNAGIFHGGEVAVLVRLGERRQVIVGHRNGLARP